MYDSKLIVFLIKIQFFLHEKLLFTQFFSISNIVLVPSSTNSRKDDEKKEKSQMKEPSSHIIGLKTEKKLSQAIESEMVFLNGCIEEVSHNVCL